MNVLVINGSPKGGRSNSLKLAQIFMEGAGWTDVEVLDVSQLKIDHCLGCFSCWNKTPGKCVIKDDMAMVLDKIIEADIIVWSFPLYYFSVPGMLKNLIDRQLPLNLPLMSEQSESGGHPARYDLSHQRHVVVSTCGFWTAQGNYDAVESLFDHCFKADRYVKVFCGQGELLNIPQLQNKIDKFLNPVREFGRRYAEEGLVMEEKTLICEPMFPRRQFEMTTNLSWGVDSDGKTLSTDGEAINQADSAAVADLPV